MVKAKKGAKDKLNLLKVVKWIKVFANQIFCRKEVDA
jgi:hypothetical protein